MSSPARHSHAGLLLSAGLLLACNGVESEPEATTAQHLPGILAVHSEDFATSACCARCHGTSPQSTALRDAKGRAVGPPDLWRASMMANASRDPLWQAQVALEVALQPARKAEIEARCLRCHAPMAVVQAELSGAPTPTMAALEAGEVAGELARDGVACALCHQIQDHALGQRGALGGGFRVGRGRRIFGPYEDVWTHPMVLQASYIPGPGSQVKDAGLCGTCHGWLHRADPDAPEVALESTFLEWQASAHGQGDTTAVAEPKTCQGCHMLAHDRDGVPIATAIARQQSGLSYPSLKARQPFARHDFVGGNTLIPAVLRDHREDLRPDVPAAEFDALIQRVRRQLRHETATLELLDASRAPSGLRIQVRVKNLAGHRLPSSYPGRRMWLRLRLRDAAGNLRWASGEHDSEGRLLDGAGAVLAAEKVGGGYLPHRDELHSADQVQVYEAIAMDRHGQRTSAMLATTGYLKDSRLLPIGWHPGAPSAAQTAPVLPTPDGNFDGGGDTVTWVLSAASTAAGAGLDPASPGRAGFDPAGVHSAEIALLYQPLGARHLAELLAVDTLAGRRLARLLQGADLGPTTLAELATPLP